MTTAAATYTYEVIRDCGYGRVWTRLAADRDDAIRKAREWQREGRSDTLINGGDWFLRKIREVPNTLGGLHKEPVGPFERFDD